MPAEWADGLTDDQIKYAEAVFGFRFPPDYRTLISERLPLALLKQDGTSVASFPDWRNPSSLLDQVNWPWLSLCIDVVEYDQFWLEQWGPKPDDIRVRMQVVRELYMDAPALIPIFGHRYIPEGPSIGNPVLSVYQTDIIVYGWNLESYLRAEFFSQPADLIIPEGVVKLGLWDDIMNAE